MAYINKNQENNLNNSIMILTIDIGNGICDKLRIHNLNNYEQETYDFCANNNLDFHTMREINNQIQKVINDNKIFNSDSELNNNKQNNNFQNNNQIEQKNIKKSNNNNSNKRKKIPNKKIINRYNSNALSYIKRKNNKEFNKNNSYGIFNNNTRVSTNSSKGSSIIYNNKQKNNIISNVKNAFNAIKKNSTLNTFNSNKSNNNLIIKNNIYKEIKYTNNLEYSSNTNTNEKEKYNENKDYKNDNSEENIKILLSDLNEEKNDFNIYSKKRKESIEILNTEEINVDNIDNKIINKEENDILLESNKENKQDNWNDINKDKDKDNASTKDIIKDNIKNRSKSERCSYTGNPESSMRKINKEKNRCNSLKKEKNKYNFSFNDKYQKNNKNIKKYEEYYEEIIKNYKKYKEEKHKDLIEKQEIEFKKICTFQPNINKNSNNKNSKDDNNEDNNKRSKSFSTFDKLYNDRIRLKENKKKLKEEIDKKFNFKPKINQKSLYKMGKISFNERLKLYSNRTKEKFNKIQQDLENKRKINECFKPKLNLNKNKELLKERDEINNTNNKYEKYNKQYLYGQKYEQKRKYLTEKFFEEKFKSPECCQMTNNIFNQKKEKSFKKLFKLLDGDNDGQISYNCISIKQLPKNIQDILEPIFLELKIENEVLNENEFIFVCEKYYNTLKYDQKRKLILFDDEERKKQKKEKIEKENKNYTFRPKINKYINLTYEKNIHNLNRVSSYEISENKSYNRCRIKSIDLKEFNFYKNNEINNKKIINNVKLDDNINNKNVNSYSLCNLFIKNNDNIKEIIINNCNSCKKNNFIIQNLRNTIDKEITYRKDKENDKDNNNNNDNVKINDKDQNNI